MALDPRPQVRSLEELRETSWKLSREIIDITTRAGSGHPSSSLSAIDILTVLYFGAVMRYDLSEILEAFDEVRQVKDRPQMIISSTLKGKGLSPFEADNVNRKHGEPLTEEEKQIALAEIDEMLQRS